MPRRLHTPDRLFDHTWRSGHPYGRRTGRLRRWAMILLLIVLCTVIGGYGYLTDSERVRFMAESYLSSLTGGRVTMGGATLSVFEGLRLDDVKVYVDDGEAADSLMFSAQTFVISYDPRTMLAGRLEATQIIAQKPHVHLTENVDDGTWNWHRLASRRPRRDRPRMGGAPGPLTLPDVMLRNARVEISEIRGGRLSTLGFMTIDGQLMPAPLAAGEASTTRRLYHFDLQSRGLNDGVGPFVTGSITPSTGQVSAKLMNFEFGRDVLSILPAEVRAWWERHELSGRVNIPVLSYTPPTEGRRAKFKIETELNGVTLAVPPEEWLTRQEASRLDHARKAIVMMHGLHELAGIRGRSDYRQQPRIGREPAHREDYFSAQGPDARRLSPVNRLLAMMQRVPVRLQNVAGKFIFTEDGVEIRHVSGRVENNGLKISGRIYGYRPDARMTIRVSSLDTENLVIPASPRYISSLPPQVRDLYEEIRPQGTGRIALEITRPIAGARPVVDGRLDILDGQFLYHKFPYPMRNARGRVLFGRDPVTGLDRVAIQGLRGRGIESGPNRDTYITLDGRIEPLGPTSGVNITVRGANVHSEEALRQALPQEVRDALKVFDAEGKGRFPTFTGDFECRIVRPLGHRTRWSFDTDLTLHRGSGMLEAFPYPMKDVRGKIRIRDGYADIVDATMQRGDATMTIAGRVAWGTSPPTAPASPGAKETPLRDPFRRPGANAPVTALKVTVRNLPIDADLLAGLPPERRAWLEKVELAGALNVDGRVFEAKRDPENGQPRPRMRPLDYEFAVAVVNGSLRPMGGAFDVSDIGGRFLLTPRGIMLDGMVGKRGDATVSADGAIDWSAREETVADVRVGASNLLLDRPLFDVLPRASQNAWKSLQPKGTVDVDLFYKGAVDAAPKSKSADAAALPASLRAVLKPRELSVVYKEIPYPLEQLGGAVRIEGGRVSLEDITARHGDATVWLSGAGTLGKKAVWDVRLAAENVPADDELRKALPPAVSDLLESLKVTGTLGFEFSKLVYRSPDDAAASTDSASGVESIHLGAEDAPQHPEIDMAATVSLHDGSLETGVALEEVQGRLRFDASLREGRLSQLSGDASASSMKMADRLVRDFHCELVKPSNRTELRLEKMQGEMAGGALAGNVKITYPEVGKGSRYSADLVVRGADVRALVDEPESDLSGRLTASLSVEGSWDDPAARRGRGDVVASGREMYRIPLLLGLSQITNLAVPISSPFKEATAQFSIQGQHIAFENIELKASNMLMTGNGHLDFGTKKVALTFVTDNPRGLKVPFLNDIFQGARQELLKIHVRGTVEEPKVSAGMMGTFTTTVDEVFKGDPPTPRKKRR